MENRTGQSLKGYELLERIGSGGFGAVYRAYQSTIGREVAVKVILPHFANRPDFIRRFEAEAQLVARLEHLHIVPLYDYWREPGAAFLVMRWLRGGSVADTVREGALSLQATAVLLDQVAAALTVAHAAGVVHRDLKPSNILLDEEGNAYLADFGIAADLRHGDGSGNKGEAVLGSPAYLAPEEVRGEALTARTDIYSLGVSLYELLTGAHPFAGANKVELLYKQINDPLPPLTTLAGDVGRDLDVVIQRATAKDPQQRYDNALELAVAFRKAARLKERAAEELAELLTPREKEILQFVADGLSNRQIAQELFVEHSTVKWHIRQIYGKLDVRSRRQAIAKAQQMQLAAAPETAVAAESTSIILPIPVVTNPYKGLRPFTSADRGDFYGREALLADLLQRLQVPAGPVAQESAPGAGRFLALLGPSGSGKSSLVRAGLVPALWDGQVPGSDQWFVVELAPGARPLDELEVALMRVAADQAGNLREPLLRDAHGLLRAAQLILPRDDSELVLVIDQFEELFSLVEDEAERALFLDLLAAAVTDPRSRVRVILALRADYYDRPLHYLDFGQLVRTHMETVLPLKAEELELAIARPAEQVGVVFEPGLVTRIIDDVLYQPGALPLLQYALTELFEQRDERTLTHEAYEALDGAAGALVKRAEELYEELDESGRELIRQLFLRLVSVGPEDDAAPDTRRRVTVAELMELEAGEDLLEEIIDTFAAYRLLTLDHDPASRRPTVEVAHEALLREWDRLRQWLNESRDDIRKDHALARSAEEWELHGRDESFLLRGTRLEQVQQWAATSSLMQTPLQKIFISQSLLQRDRERQAETQRKQREAQLERRSQTFLRGLVVVLTLATLVSGALAFFGFTQRQSALTSAANAQNVALVAGSQAALANHDTDTAVALAWQAVALNPDSAAAQAQLSEVAYAPGTIRILEGNDSIVNRIMISPDDQTAFAGTEDGTVLLWELATGRPLWQHRAHTEEVNDVAFSPDGQYAAATFNDRIMFWHTADGQIQKQIESTALDQKIAFSPTGDQFVTIGKEEEGRLRLWQFPSMQIAAEFERGSAIEDIAYTADGTAIVLASVAGVLTLLDARTGEVIYEVQEDLGVSAGALRFIELSKDGTQVRAAFTNAGLLIWQLETGDLVSHFRYGESLFALATNPQDDTVLIGNEGLRTIDPQTGAVLRVNSADDGAIFGIATSSDGKHAVTTALDGTVRLWALQGGQVVRRFAGPSTLSFEVDLSPDGRTVIAGSSHGTVSLWDMESAQLIHRLVTDQPIMAVTFSPDGRRALIGTGYRFAQQIEPGHIILWDVETGTEIRRLEGQPYVVADVEFSPDGRLAVSGGNGAMAILWDLETGEEIRRFDEYWVDSIWPHESFLAVEFSPDGQEVFAAHSSGPIIAWNVNSGELIRQLDGHVGVGATSIIFSADGQRLASGGLDSQILMWDLPQANILKRFSVQGGAAGHVAFSADEGFLFGGGSGSNALWQMDLGQVIRRYGGGFAISPHFTADGRLALIGMHDGAVELWRIDSTLDELLTWTRNNRYLLELSCEQRDLYRIEPLCEEESLAAVP